mmetsp:Transcript_44427/g.71198  ORF Transcript_44427/g.71198 Transcript_44427/m.71198 type:complete len:522 (+) Transcript_44427:572-2137(+)
MMMVEREPTFEFEVTFRNKSVTVKCARVAELQDNIAQLFDVPVPNQKLIAKGGKVVAKGESKVDDEEFIKLQGHPLRLVGSTKQDLERVPDVEANENRNIKNDLDVDYDKVMKDRERQLAKLELDERKRRANRTEYRFESFRVLQQFKDKDKALEILERLATEPGFVEVLKKHKWKIGALTEMYPEGYVGVSDVCLLGVNINKGQEISLRLRTDDLKGFRKYLEIRATLIHELAHMENHKEDHGPEFYMLMREIEKEVVTLDWRQGAGQTLGGESRLIPSVLVHDSSKAEVPKGGEYTLGGDLMSTGASAVELAGRAAEIRAQNEIEAIRKRKIKEEERVIMKDEDVNINNMARSPSEQFEDAKMDLPVHVKEASVNSVVTGNSAGVDDTDVHMDPPAEEAEIEFMVISELKQSSIKEAIAQVVERNTPERSLRTLETLVKITRNIIRDPSNEKFRRLRLGNPALKATIRDTLGGKNVLSALQWTEVDDCLILFNSEENLTICEFAKQELEKSLTLCAALQ